MPQHAAKNGIGARPAGRPAAGVAAAVAVVVIALVTAESFVAIAIVLLEGVVAWAVLGGAALAGGWAVRWLGLKHEPWPVRIVLGAGLGIGALAAAVLALGCAGLLTKPVAWVLAATFAAAGIGRLVSDIRQERGSRVEPSRAGAVYWLWVLFAPFLAITLMAASLPPGVLWAEEGSGYDVLEYHLAVPKEWHDAGQITFLPNNAYSNFPMNAEMISLLMMTLRGDAIEAAFMAQMANVGQACLFVAAAWLAGRRFSRAAGVTCGVLAAGVPWLAYLSGIAYVEPGMMAMGMCAVAALLHMDGQAKRDRAMCIAAGLLAGLACGYKYTAVALIALPLVALVLTPRATIAQRISRLVVYTLAVLAAFSPWLIRNTVNTHNPVFPLGWSVFGAKTGLWDAELEARWQRAHASPAAEQAETPTALRALQRTVGEERMGYVVFVLAAVGAVVTRDRWTAGLAVVLIVQACVWFGATHLFARFAVVLLLPLLALAGRTATRSISVSGEMSRDDPSRGAGSGADPPELNRAGGARANKLAHATRTGGLQTQSHTTGRPWLVVLTLLLVAGTGFNLYRLWDLYYHHTRLGSGAEPIGAYGQTQWFVEGQWPWTEHIGAINRLDVDGRTMLVGEARTYYLRRPCTYAVAFNHHPLARAARECADASGVMDRLRGDGITHVLAHWDEIGRLRSTYGLDPEIDRVLFDRLAEAGLRPTAEFRIQEGATPYATLFEVPKK